MKKLLIIFLFAFQFVKAADNSGIFSPGIKLGYAFGEHGGFICGVELSYVFGLANFVGSGPVLNIDYFNKTLKIHLNAEIVPFIGGFAAGPTLVLKESEWYWGYNFSLFLGLQFYLFYNYTNIYKYKFEETGFLFKAPIFITGKISAG